MIQKFGIVEIILEIPNFTTLSHKMSISNECRSFDLSIHQRMLKNIYHGFQKKLK